MIPLSVPEISGNEWKYVKECLDTGWVSSAGPFVNRFEETVRDYLGARHAIAVCNGTSALHLSLLLCDVEADDEVIIPDLTFVAVGNVVRYVGAWPVLMDCDKDTLCLNVQKVLHFLQHECEQKKDGFTYNKKSKRRVKAVIPVHIFGHPVDMDPLKKLGQEYNIRIIEDATESLGSHYKNKLTGNLGDIGCLSFNGNKIITTGGGGMILTDNEQWAKKAKHMSTQAKMEGIEYDHDQIGFNYRLTNVQAAIGLAQMEQLEKFIEIKRKNAALYREGLESLSGVDFLGEAGGTKSNFWFYTIRVERSIKNDLLQFLLAQKIEARPLWKLMHTLPMFRECQSYQIKEANEAYESCLNIPCSVGLKKEDVQFVLDQIQQFFKTAVLEKVSAKTGANIGR